MTVDAVLNETMIGVVTLREVDAALAQFPVWEHPFAGMEFSRARRSYGQAHADGRIVLTSQFLGTRALTDLEDTLRHEIAHLIVGVRERHGPRWKAVARALGAVPRASGRSQASDLHARMNNAPYMLVAIMADGSERELKSAFRRSRRFIAYRDDGRQPRYFVAGEPVARFVYRERPFEDVVAV